MTNTVKMIAYITKKNVDDLLKSKLILPGSKTFNQAMAALKK